MCLDIYSKKIIPCLYDHCTDDANDGMGLAVQLPPTDSERATMCRCKPRPNLNFTLLFSYCGAEAGGLIAVTVVVTGKTSVPYNVTISPSESVPLSAREMFDFSNEAIEITFNRGETKKTVFVEINPDCIREGTEHFNHSLSLDFAAMAIGITLSD